MLRHLGGTLTIKTLYPNCRNDHARQRTCTSPSAILLHSVQQWYPENTHRIDKVINFALRVISGRRKFDAISDVRREHGWLTAAEMFRHRTICLARNILINGEPASLARQFVSVASTRDRATRQDDQLHVPRSRIEAGKRMFARRAPLALNSLPAELRTATCTNSSFNRRLKRHILGIV